MPSSRSDSESKPDTPRMSRRQSTASTASNDTMQSFGSGNTTRSGGSEPRSDSSGYNQEDVDPFSQLTFQTEDDPQASTSTGSRSWNPIIAVWNWFNASDDVQPGMQEDPYRVLFDTPSGTTIQLPVTGGPSIGAQIDKWITDFAEQFASASEGSRSRSPSPRRRSSSIPRGNSSSRAPDADGLEEEETDETQPRSETRSSLPRQLPTTTPGRYNASLPSRSDGRQSGSSNQPQQTEQSTGAFSSPAVGSVVCIRMLQLPASDDSESQSDLPNKIRSNQRATDYGQYGQLLPPRSGSPSIRRDGLESYKSPGGSLQRPSPGIRERDTVEPSMYDPPPKYNLPSMQNAPSLQATEPPTFQPTQTPAIQVHSPESPGQDDQNYEGDQNYQDDRGQSSSNTSIHEGVRGLSVSQSAPSIRYSPSTKEQSQMEQDIRGLEPRTSSNSRENFQHEEMGYSPSDDQAALPSTHQPAPHAPNFGSRITDPTTDPGTAEDEQPSSNQVNKTPLSIERLQGAHSPTSTTSDPNIRADGREPRRLAGQILAHPNDAHDSAWSRRHSGDGSDIFTSAPTRRLGGPLPPVPNPNAGRVGYDPPRLPTARGRGSVTGTSQRGRGSGAPRDEFLYSQPADGEDASPTRHSRTFGENANLGGPRSEIGPSGGYLSRVAQKGYGEIFKQRLPDYLDDLWSHPEEIPEEFEDEYYFDDDGYSDYGLDMDVYEDEHDTSTGPEAPLEEGQEPFEADNSTEQPDGIPADIDDPIAPPSLTTPFEELIQFLREQKLAMRAREKIDREAENDELEEKENVRTNYESVSEDTNTSREESTDVERRDKSQSRSSFSDLDQTIQPGTFGGYMIAPDLNATVDSTDGDVTPSPSLNQTAFHWPNWSSSSRSPPRRRSSPLDFTDVLVRSVSPVSAGAGGFSTNNDRAPNQNRADFVNHRTDRADGVARNAGETDTYEDGENDEELLTHRSSPRRNTYSPPPSPEHDRTVSGSSPIYRDGGRYLPDFRASKAKNLPEEEDYEDSDSESISSETSNLTERPTPRPSHVDAEDPSPDRKGSANNPYNSSDWDAEPDQKTPTRKSRGHSNRNQSSDQQNAQRIKTQTSPHQYSYPSNFDGGDERDEDMDRPRRPRRPLPGRGINNSGTPAQVSRTSESEPSSTRRGDLRGYRQRDDEYDRPRRERSDSTEAQAGVPDWYAAPRLPEPTSRDRRSQSPERDRDVNRGREDPSIIPSNLASDIPLLTPVPRRRAVNPNNELGTRSRGVNPFLPRERSPPSYIPLSRRRPQPSTAQLPPPAIPGGDSEMRDSPPLMSMDLDPPENSNSQPSRNDNPNTTSHSVPAMTRWMTSMTMQPQGNPPDPQSGRDITPAHLQQSIPREANRKSSAHKHRRTSELTGQPLPIFTPTSMHHQEGGGQRSALDPSAKQYPPSPPQTFNPSRTLYNPTPSSYDVQGIVARPDVQPAQVSSRPRNPFLPETGFYVQVQGQNKQIPPQTQDAGGFSQRGVQTDQEMRDVSTAPPTPDRGRSAGDEDQDMEM